uniref:Large ribosomal subunit protein mL54 n=1 Tax=Strigops habroptila TaxID=2489341 RepID=A0A672UHW1_STRHB
MRCPAPPGGPRPSERSAYPGASPSRLRPSRRAPRAHHGGPGAATAAGGAPGPARGYAKKPAMKAKGKSVPKEGLKAPEVCTDPAMLATYAMGVNYFKDGPRWPEARHPSTRTGRWLFKIHLGPPKKLEELDPNSIEYWRRLRKYNTWQNNRRRRRLQELGLVSQRRAA